MALRRRNLINGLMGMKISVRLKLQVLFGVSILMMAWFVSPSFDDIQSNRDYSDRRQDFTHVPPSLDLTEGAQLIAQKSNVQTHASPGGTFELNKHKLRFDWTNLPVKSEIAKLMLSHQTNCSLPLGNHNWRKKIFGLGSDIHVWGAALCNAIDEGVRIRTYNANPWVWIDQERCATEVIEATTLQCYFPHVEMQCPGDTDIDPHVQFAVSNPIHVKCDKTISSPMNIFNKTDWRAAGVEFLFSRVSKIVQEEGERQLNLVFPDGVPSDLITVHMRWGDKKFENKITGVSQTLKGIETIRRKRGDNLQDPVSIFLCTEDPDALDGFFEAAPKNWKIYIDYFYHEMLPFRPKDKTIYNKVPKMARSLHGKPGLWSLGSLLVSMEANAFVLVLSSNWSRVIDELRRNVLDPRCQDCTYVVDVAEGKWKEW